MTMSSLTRRFVAGLLVLLLSAGLAFAQFAEQRTYGGTSGGAANAQTITIANMPSTIPSGVPFKFIAGFTNTGATTLTIAGGSGAKNVFKPGPVGPVALAGSEIGVGDLVTVIYDGTQYQLVSVQAVSGPMMPASFKNLVIKVTSNTAATVTADAVTVENAAGAVIRLKTVSLTLATGTTGANGLDLGSMAAATWYSVNTIYNPTTGAVAVLISTQSVCLSATLPSGYTYCSRYGWVRTAAGNTNLMGTWQFGKRAQYVVGLAQTTVIPSIHTGATGNITTPTWTAKAIGNFVPTTASEIFIALNAYSATSNSFTIVAPNNSYGAYASNTNPPPLQGGTDAFASQAVTSGGLTSFILESTNIYIASNGGGAVNLTCNGWVDNL